MHKRYTLEQRESRRVVREQRRLMKRQQKRITGGFPGNSHDRRKAMRQWNRSGIGTMSFGRSWLNLLAENLMTGTSSTRDSATSAGA